ncbi:hypothetical protein [Pseudomonas sp. PS01303]|uniref:hypothetical protein n=1 Tax=Pseudomonas sp. PS01303 TaxID=2991439 RepID=UPI00249C2457|nr:hypothetical protein [Pseudomonas sp. PS01303]
MRLATENRKMLRELLKAYDQRMWFLVSYAREAELLKYDPEYATTNESIRRLGATALRELQTQILANNLEIPVFAKAIEAGELNLKKIIAHQPRSDVRWHLNNARHEVLNEMRKDWANVRITIQYIHPDA